jgi:GDP-L-fucose synthase
VARGLLLAGERYQEPRLVNLSSGVDTSVREVVETLTELTGFRGRVLWDTSKPDGQLRRVFDITRARRELGYQPEVDLKEGLRRTVEWYRAHRRQLVGGRVYA